MCRRRRLLAPLAVALLLGLAPTDARACSCVQVTPELALAEHDAVFEGRVLSIERAPDPSGRTVVTFEVVQHWKGVETERLVVSTAAMESMCGVEFTADTSWLVYADREGDALSTGLCSRTRRIEDAEADLAALGAGVVPVEIGEDDEVEGPAEPPPTRAGCASCTVGAASSGAEPGTALAGLLVLALVARRRRR